MKQFLLIFILLTSITLPTRAQTWSEWFRQRETQKDYLVQQIAALQAYAGTLRQGYQVLAQGISTVQQIRQSDLGLHQVFFHSLLQINPTLLPPAQLADIIGWQAALQRDLALLQSDQHLQHLRDEERAYLRQVSALVRQACLKDLESLALLSTADKLALPDAEWLGQVDALHQAMRSHYQFTRHLLGQAQALATQRRHEQENLRRTGTLYRQPLTQ